MKTLLPLLLLLLASAALADDAGLLKCRSLSDPTARLSCYDALPLGESRTVQGPPRQTPQQFGLEEKAAQVAVTLDSIETTIAGRLDGWGPRSVIRLANGQAWQIADDSRSFHDIQNPKVAIRRGALGAFYMEIEGTNNSPRVKRVQ